jgi:hypothetical protein
MYCQLTGKINYLSGSMHKFPDKFSDNNTGKEEVIHNKI